jgi:hypothetical protein
LSRRWASEHGSSLVEVLVAASIMVVGLFGTMMMFDHASTTASSTRAREQAVELQRELVEAARAIPFQDVTPTSIVSRLQAKPGLGDASSTQPGWQIVRRGVSYTVTAGACTVDDPGDKTGPEDPTLYCAAQPTGAQCSQWLGITGSVQGVVGAASAAAAAGVGIGGCGLDLNLDGTVDGLVQTDANVGICLPILITCQGNGDTNPDDYKRIVTLVRWDRGTGSRYALQSTTIPNGGLSGAPSITSVTPASTPPITTGNNLAFTATTNRTANNVSWYVDGTQQGAAAASGANWTWTWSLGNVNNSAGASPGSSEVLDGAYVVGAKAFDQYGQYGSTRATTVAINRRRPYAPDGFAGGRNGSAVDFEWSLSPERDLQGYRVYRVPLLGSDVLVCSLTAQTSCQDTSPPAGTQHYRLVAVDTDTAGALREGDTSATITVNTTNDPPYPPTNLSLSSSGGRTTLTWTASPGDPNSLLGGDHVDYYRIYRDGTAFANRYDRTGDETSTTWIDTNTGGTTHQYWVVAVDTQLAQSSLLGPVTG